MNTPFRTKPRGTGLEELAKANASEGKWRNLSFAPVMAEFMEIGAARNPDWTSLRKWALHPDERVALRMLERLADWNPVDRSCPSTTIEVNLSIKVDEGGNVAVQAKDPPSPSEPVWKVESARLAYLLYCRAVRDAESEALVWTPLLDALVHVCWPYESAHLREDDDLARGEPVWAGTIVEELSSWIRKQTNPLEIEKLLDFEFNAIARLVGHHCRCLTPDLVRLVLQKSGNMFFHNEHMTPELWRVVMEWALDVFQDPDPQAGWLPWIPSQHQDSGDAYEAFQTLQHAVGTLKIPFLHDDIELLLNVAKRYGDGQPSGEGEFAEKMRAWTTIPLLRMKALNPQILEKLFDYVGADSNLRRRIGRHSAATPELRERIATADRENQHRKEAEREARRERERIGTGAASLPLTKQTAQSILDDTATPPDLFVRATIVALTDPLLDSYGKRSTAEQVLRDSRVASAEALTELMPHVVPIFQDSPIFMIDTAVSAACRAVPLRTIRLMEPLILSEHRSDDVTRALALRASAIYDQHGDKSNDAINYILSLIERASVRNSSDGQPSPHSAMDILQALSPLFLEPIWKMVEDWLEPGNEPEAYPAGGAPSYKRMFHYLCSCHRMPADTLDGIVDREQYLFDRAVSHNAGLSDMTAWRLYRRYRAEGGKRYRATVAPAASIVQRIVEEQDADGMRGLARKLDRVEPHLREGVAKVALREILKDPEPLDVEAAGAIYTVLGEDAGVALIELGDDQFARAVVRAWRWTPDRVFEAAATYPRREVRRKLVPSGPDWGEPYDFTPAERERIQSIVIPRMLMDRSGQVRQRAQDLLDYWARDVRDEEDVLAGYRPFWRVPINTELDA